jgi:hypothetical protein
MDIAGTITQHTIVLCVDKRERGIGIQTLLSKAGFNVVMALSLYDALKYVAQDMPHLVITESLLSDGTAGTLYDRLQQHETLKKTPIMVLVLKKTREELAPLAQRKFAGFFLGPLEPKSFMAKVNEIIGAHSLVSPYFVPAGPVGIGEDMTISIEAAVMGRTGEQLVSRSTTEVDPSASMLCVPSNPELGPAVLRMATNLREGEEIFNLFPISRIVGNGRKWVMGLPEIKLGEKAAAAKVRKIILYEPNEQRLESFREILKGYDIEVLPAKSMATAAAILKRDPVGIGCVYLHELLGDASGIEWKNVYGKLPPSQRPPLIVGTTSMNARPTPQIRYLKRPFGMGLFIEMLEASFERGGDLAEAAGKNASTTTQGLPVKFQATAKLLGIDETGGVILIKFPLVKGSRLSITHKFLESAWEGKTNVQITAASSFEGKPDVWHARFEAVGAGMSKVKYWDRITKQLGALVPGLKQSA